MLDTQNLKILIVSTPKTGNTWLNYLLSAVYDLPTVEPPADFNADELAGFGLRWVGHQHYYPHSNIINWAKTNDVVLLSTLRHPADVLISFYHHIRNSPEVSPEVISQLKLDEDKVSFEASLEAYVKSNFFFELNVSLLWLFLGLTKPVRYESLWRDPFGTLKELTDYILSVPDDTIGRAIEQCDITLLRGINKAGSKLFRQGSVGNWRKTLSPAILELLSSYSPYPEQFAQLGYTLDPNDPLINDPAKLFEFPNPFRQITHFDNGVVASPILAKLYLSIPSEQSQKWLPIEQTVKPDSFLNWANAPAPNRPLVTNLAAFIHKSRYDLRMLFPDNWLDYLFWFIANAKAEYDLAEFFIQPVQARLLDWATANDPLDTTQTDLPSVTNLAAYFHAQRPDLKAKLPDLYGVHRLGFLFWFLRNARADYNVPDIIMASQRHKILNWANTPHQAKPELTNLAMGIWNTRPDLRQAFPDPVGQNRLDYLLWFIGYGRIEYNLEAEFVRPMIANLLSS